MIDWFSVFMTTTVVSVGVTVGIFLFVGISTIFDYIRES